MAGLGVGRGLCGDGFRIVGLVGHAGPRSQFLGLLEGQPALALEEFAQAFVAGTGWSPDDSWGHAVARLAAGAAAFEPVFPANWLVDRNHRDSGFGELLLVHR